MIALIQRVRKASVIVDDRVIGEIGAGLLALIGVEKDDSERNAGRMLDRLLGYRVFQDADDRMNRSLNDVEGGLLLVPQFTLAADTRKGTRPGFSTAAPPAHAERLFAVLENLARASYPRVSSGRFGAEMEVSLVNHGPVTFWLTA
ncbi:MAG: D-tyrosyl-tRNA(Tyr) deacylase [Rhodocyclaceae bacterium]|nr:D-tyrosyl-tRNA(Tyr) deacylase [Rhodocyclaceae bacterium]MCP5231606.1 D-tyrosyl-tRNA(Tyr) deacylase [Zoogloeaceae bacterium]MCB1911671.1 D-tyrosyl-tRNA(Tyr) deacylase [Rhodocyclaceae bacterium]MCP5254819.1 D-tyrosyl-tRNA(Tyr) deacylase [Zoogloeaceae bacterium]MCP5294451.1 D-tyrosyl-tRNA(Tyr) deacylase [Zoogloeaceae bacterium]